MKSALVASLFTIALGLSSLLLYVKTQNVTLDQEVEQKNKVLDGLPHEAVIPVFTGSSRDKQAIATVSATALQITDRETGVVVLASQSQSARYPASTAKLMTARVARKLYSLDQVLKIREEVFAEGTVTGFQLGEQMTVRNVLHALLLQSGNDAAFVLANNAPGGYQAFVKQMNDEAKALGMSDTTFANASGLDDQAQQSTAADLNLLTEAVLTDPVLAEIVSTREKVITDTTGLLQHPLINRNQLSHSLPGVFGVKTGTTESAGENLITALRRNNREFVIVVLGSQQRYIETLQLIQWMDHNYRWEVRRVGE